MVRYIDLKLNIDASQTRSVLSWTPTSRYHILRRLLFLLVNMKGHPNEWKVTNDEAMKHESHRPNFILYEHMIMEREKIIARIENQVMAPEMNGTFAHYQKMENNEFTGILTTLYHLLMASVRSSDRSLLIKYIDDIALQRFIAGFKPDEICSLLNIVNDTTTNTLLAKKELKKMKQLMHDFFSLSLQLAQDEIEEIYDNLGHKLSVDKIENLVSIKQNQERQDMIAQLSSFYQNFPSG